MARNAARALALALCTFAPSLLARAEPARSRVAVVRSESTDRLLRDASTRLRAELTAAGFEVIEVERVPGDAREGVEQAETGTSFATVALNRASFGAFADVWISDRVTGKTVVRRLEVGAASNAATVLAIRALELLRASLLEVKEQAPSEPVLAPPRDVLAWVEPALPEEPPAPRAPFAGATLGVSALSVHGTSGLGFAFGPSFSLAYGLPLRLFTRAALNGPLIGPDPTRSEGSAAVRQEFAAFDFGGSTRGTRVAGYAFVGVGLFHLHVAGSSSAAFRAQSDDAFAFLSRAGVGGLARLSSRTALSAELSATLLVPHPVVVIAQKDSGSAGLPSLGFSLGVLVGL